MKKKLVKKIAVSLCLASMFLGTHQCIASAANTADTTWTYNVGGDSDNIRFTGTRTKQNNTKAYCKVSAFSTNHKSGDWLAVTLVDKYGNTFSRDFERSFNRPGQYSITNLAYEDRGKCDVQLRFKSINYRKDYTWYASGVWSPDSTRVYN